MVSIQHVFPAPPAAVWQALPAGVHATNGRSPSYDPRVGSVQFSTGTTLRTWGQNINARISPTGDGRTVVEVQVHLKLGLIDWGEGNKICQQFLGGVDAALAAGPQRMPMQGGPHPPPPGMAPPHRPGAH